MVIVGRTAESNPRVIISCASLFDTVYVSDARVRGNQSRGVFFRVSAALRFLGMNSMELFFLLIR